MAIPSFVIASMMELEPRLGELLLTQWPIRCMNSLTRYVSILCNIMREKFSPDAFPKEVRSLFPRTANFGGL